MMLVICIIKAYLDCFICFGGWKFVFLFSCWDPVMFVDFKLIFAVQTPCSTFHYFCLYSLLKGKVRSSCWDECYIVFRERGGNLYMQSPLSCTSILINKGCLSSLDTVLSKSRYPHHSHLAFVRERAGQGLQGSTSLLHCYLCL